MQELAALLNIKVEVLELFMEANLTVDIVFAEQLSRAIKVGTATWLELQRQYDEYKKHC
jgi:plasmid maintenance system antidote protein VapI